MATALQRQLASIASTSTHTLNLRAQKAAHGKSLLFEPSVAATQDFNTLYRICVTDGGFEELCTLDGRFEVFKGTVFGVQSRDEERGTMGKEENEELDRVIERFLGLVSGRLLLKPAQKAVEWLIRRFRIHEHNTQAVILAFLPYHTTPLFLSLLSILPKQLPHTFRFLYPSIATMQAPPFHTLLHTASNTPAFFAAYNAFILGTCRARHHAPVVMSFWASLTTQAVASMLAASQHSGREGVRKSKQEDLLLRILPLLNEALFPKLADVTDLVVAACMIAVVMAVNGNLEERVLDSLMEALVAGIGKERHDKDIMAATMEERVVALSACAMNRAGSSLELSKNVAKKIARGGAIVDAIVAATGKGKVPTGRLVLGLVLRDLKTRGKSEGYLGLEGLRRLLPGALSEEMEKVLCEGMVSIMSKGHITEAQRQALSVIVEYLAESSPTRFQETVETSKVPQETIEAALQTTLLLTNSSQHPKETDADGDDEMGEAHDSITTSVNAAFESTIAKVQDHKMLSSSFLALNVGEEYALFKAVYLQALSSESNLEQFLGLFGSLNVSSTTLFLRLASDSSLAQKARATVVRSMHKLFKAEEERGPSAVLQFIVPYLVAILADKSAGVRQAAAEMFIDVAQIYETERKGQQIAAVEMHKETYPWEVLSHDDMNHFLAHVIVPSLEEATLDATIIVPAIARKLGSQEQSKTNGKPEKKLKKGKIPSGAAANAEICKYLAEHAVGTSLGNVKLPLLQVVNESGDSAADAREKITIPALKKTATTRLQLVDPQAGDEMELELWRSVTVNSTVGLELLTDVLSGSMTGISASMVKAAYSRVTEIWPTIPPAAQENLASFLINASLRSLETSEPDLYQSPAAETIRALKLPTHVLASLLKNLPNSINMPDGPPTTKRRRTSRSSQARMAAIEPESLSAALSRYALVLELVEANQPGEHTELIQAMFSILQEVQNFRLQTQSGLVYLQGLALSCLLAMVEGLKKRSDVDGKAAEKTALESIRADLIVDVIRHSTSTQVQSTALLLISSLASWQPDSVVNSIMPIFTFMGNTILRQADSYSAHVTEKTISRVVPPLVESFKKKNKDVAVGAASLLASFAAAFEHIPLHRRLSLFEHLVRTVGEVDALWALVAMLTDTYPTDVRVRKFIAELLNKFDPATSLKTVRKCLDLMWDIFRPRRTISNSVLNMAERSKEGHDNVAANLLGALAELLGDRQLRAAMSSSFDSGDIDVANAQRTTCVELIQEAIRLNGFMKQNKPELVNPAANVLSAIVNLLPTQELVQCSETLLAQRDDEVRLVAIGSVLSRAKEVKNPTTDDVASLLGFLKQATGLLVASESVAIATQAITCVGQIVKTFGKKDTSVVVEAAQVVDGHKALGNADQSVQLASIVTLTITVRVLKDEFIPLVPAVLPTVFKYLDQALSSEESSKTLALSIGSFSFAHALVEHLPFLITGENLDRVMKLLAKAADGPSRLKEGRTGLWRLLAKNVEADELFAALERNFEAVAAEAEIQALVEMFSSLRLAITSRPKSVIIRNASTLFDLFLKAFDQPRVVQTADEEEVDFDEEELEKLQAIYHEVALTMVMKLNDATFRPFIVRLAEWATKLPKKDHQGWMLRSTSLFSFLASLFAKLKGLVTSYATYVLDLAATVLGSTEPRSEEEAELLMVTLSALSESFEHDDEQFWQSPHHFTPIATPLIELLAKSALTTRSTLTAKIQSTILALASATSSQDQHKAINTALLKMLRHDDAKVRLVAVKVERELCERMSDEWQAMLAEMLPYVAEVLEDDDRDVERAGREWVRYLEEVLGETLELS